MGSPSPYIPLDIAPGVQVQMIEFMPSNCYGRVVIAHGAPGWGFSPKDDKRLVVATSAGLAGVDGDSWLLIYRIEQSDPDSALKELEHIALEFIEQHRTPVRDFFRSPAVVYGALAIACVLDWFRGLPVWVLVLDSAILVALAIVLALVLSGPSKKG